MSTLPFRPSQGWYVKDDFYTNEAAADATVGELDWEVVTIGNADTLAYLVTTNTTAGRPGVLRLTTNNTADGDGAVLRLDEDAVVLKGREGSIEFAVRYVTAVASHNFRIGLQDSVTATSPTVGLWVDSDGGVITLQADSADHGDVSAAAAGVSTLTDGTTLVADTWHDFRLAWGGENAQGGPKEAFLWIDGELACELRNIAIDDDEEMELSIAHYQDSGAGAAKSIDIDYIDCFIAGRG
jgi:hypothetical protein